jgi:hypothetical protein
MSKKMLLAASAVAVLSASPAFAAGDADLQALRAEIQAMRQFYERKIEQLEQNVDTLTAQQDKMAAKMVAIEPAAYDGKALPPATSKSRVANNSFNPEIGVILQGRHNSFSEETSELAGFAVGEEAERPSEGFNLGETELNFSANVDNLFKGAAAIGIHEHGGHTELHVEEAYLQTTSLLGGVSAKAGRFFQELGYLNSHHSHEDDFSDRPLTNRAFLNNHFNDDGVEVSWILPTDFYTEIGGSALKGRAFPAGGAAGSDVGAWTAYGRVGGDVGDNTSWRFGLSTLQAEGIERAGNEDLVTFKGDSNLYIADARLTYAPTGNSADQEILLQGEYFYRDEDGTYEDTNVGTGVVAYDDNQSGWYAQGVYKFRPQWRVGVRYSQLDAGSVPAGLVGSALDASGHNPWTASTMVDWSNSEFSRVRAQFNREELSYGNEDNQILLQYIMSLGAHGAHPF